MKKQIIAIVAVAVAAVLLFVAYKAFFEDNGIEEASDPFYQLPSAAADAVDSLDSKCSVELRGFDVDDDGWIMLRRFVNVFDSSSRRISSDVSEDGGFSGITVKSGDNSVDIPYDSFFLTLYDGTRFACDAPGLITNALRKVTGLPEADDIPPVAFSGYDTDGDTVTATGLPFLFKAIDRSEIAYLALHNDTGDYTIYQESGTFFYGASRVAQFNSEAFSLLTTNCRYVVTLGKMDLPTGKTWADYGLDVSAPSTAHYSIMTVPDANGDYSLHTVYIGKKAAAGDYYYARYTGGIFAYGEEDSSLRHNLTKDRIYFVPTSIVEGSLDSSANSVLSPALVTALSNTNDLLSIGDVRIDFLDKQINALVKNMSVFNPASNLAASNNSVLTGILCDKKSFTGAYEGGWRDRGDVFGGFTSSDGKDTYVEGALARYAADGRYTVRFGVLRDDASGAMLPKAFTVSASYDGVNFTAVGEPVIPSQDDKTVKQYVVSFETGDRIRFVRIGFDVPQVAQTYVVFDEVRVFADEEDAQPTDSVRGIWRLVTPDDYISSGRNFAYLDMTNFNNFVQELAAFSGSSVAYCGISDNGDATKLDTEALDKYGLKDPYRHYAFTFDGATVDFYFSKPDENGDCYAYSTVSGDYNGSYIKYTCDVIVNVSVNDAVWLGWDFFEFLDHSLVDIFIVEIDEMTVSFDGKDYRFKLTTDEADSDVIDVAYEGKSYDVKNFKYLYQYMLSIYLQDQYVPEEGDEPEEYLRIKIVSETRSPEIVFYRVSATKCYFTIDGEGSYYALVKSVNAVRDNLLAFLDGETITRPN